MNERIRAITGQVLDELVPETWTTLGYAQIKEIQYRTAELIVAECIECADTVGKNNLTSGYPNSTAHHVKQKIKQHFGVEDYHTTNIIAGAEIHSGDDGVGYSIGTQERYEEFVKKRNGN